MLQLSFKSVAYCQAISYTLNDEATQTELCTVSGVMSQEPRSELLLIPQAPQPPQLQQVVSVLVITWLHTNPLYAGFKYGACLMYLLALFAQKHYHAQYIILDDTTDVPSPCNLFHLMGFKHRARLEVGGEEFWQTWHNGDGGDGGGGGDCLGPERLIDMDTFMNSRFRRRKIQPKLATLLSLATLNYTIIK